MEPKGPEWLGLELIRASGMKPKGKMLSRPGGAGGCLGAQRRGCRRWRPPETMLSAGCAMRSAKRGW